MTGILEVQLFKNAYSDNHNRIKKFADLTAQNNYYNSLTDKIEIEGNYNKIGDNIRIVGDYATLSNYNYGRFKYHNIWFYFSVVEYLIVNEQKLEIVYSLDYYETARFQYDMSIGKGTIQNITTEYSAGKIARIPKSETGLGLLQYHGVTNGTDSYKGVIFYVYHSGTRADINGIYVLDCTNNPHDTFIQHILNGDFVNALVTYIGNVNHQTFPDDRGTITDVKGAWLVTTRFINSIKTGSWYIVDELAGLYKFSEYSSAVADEFKYTATVNLKRNDKVHTAFVDNTRSVMWETPTGVYLDKNTDIDYYVDISPSSCELKIKIHIDNNFTDNIVFPLPEVPIFSNSFDEYVSRQRSADIQLRHTNNEQQLVNGLVNIGSSVIGGAVGGAMAGGKSGAGMGAGAGFISGYIGAVGGYQVNEYYGNIQQNIIDNQYKRMCNNLLLHGDSIIDKIRTSFGFTNISYKGDLGGDRVDKIIDTYGWEINLQYPDVQSYINYIQTVSGDSYIMGNFEINGHIPDNWKKQIKDRFNGGVNYG